MECLCILLAADLDYFNASRLPSQATQLLILQKFIYRLIPRGMGESFVTFHEFAEASSTVSGGFFLEILCLYYDYDKHW